MKKVKKIASFLLAMVMVFGLTTTAFAADPKGSITIKNADDVTVEGKTFNAYKILDLKMVGDGYVYTVPAGLKEFYAKELNVSASAGDFDYQVTQKIEARRDNEEELFAFATNALAAAKIAGIVPVSSSEGVEGETFVKISNLPYGYYVLEDAGTEKPISALVLDTVNDNIEVTIKAEKPTVDKKIVEGETTTENNNAAVGDTVNYKVTSKVPDMIGYTKYYFVLNDTLSKGLTFNSNTVAINITKTVDGKTETIKTLEKDTDFTVTETAVVDKATNKPTGETAVEIVFKNFINYKDEQYKDADITVTYSATVNENAVIGVEGNSNKVTLTYSNNPNVKDDGDKDNPDKPTPTSPTGETPESITRTFVTGIELTKVDPEGNRLTGAEFEITGTKTNIVLVTKDEYTVDNEKGTYWKLKDGTYTTDAPVIAEDETDTSKLYESTTTKYVMTTSTEKTTTSATVKATGVVGSDGVLRFDGLSAGEYTITELKAPNGYNLLTEPIKIKIGWTAPTTVTGDCTWTAAKITKAADGSNKEENITLQNGIVPIQVVNQTGTELPSTGGIGTTIFYVVGSILLIGAAVLLIARRRMSTEK